MVVVATEWGEWGLNEGAGAYGGPHKTRTRTLPMDDTLGWFVLFGIRFWLAIVFFDAVMS